MTGIRLLLVALTTLTVSAPVVLLMGARRLMASVLAIGTTALATLLGLVGVLAGAGEARLPVLAVDPVGITVPLRVSGDGAAGFLTVVLLAILTAIQTYAAWYLAQDDRYAVFAATVALFGAAMVLLVLSRDLILILIAWEVMGWCSYLLIGHWSRKASARRAAYKAFIVTRLADVGFVLGVIGLTALAHTSDLDRVNAWLGAGVCDVGFCATPAHAVDLAMTALVIGVLGKSAQAPFQDWLADAMEGPTPASALIHAATMVAAGSWVLAQLAPTLLASAVAQWALTLSVSATMVFAAFTAFFQTDLKRLLAWSTISQIGVMLSPLAAATDPAMASDASVGHLYGHALFKSLLFLSVGWLGVVGGGTSARLLAGRAQGLPVARLGWAVGLAGLAGVPLTVGGFSKEAVIDVAVHDQAGGRALLVTVAVLLTVAMTAAYATRAYLVVATAPGRHAAVDGRVLSQSAAAHPRDATRSVRAVILALTGATLLGGLAFVAGALPSSPFSVPVLGGSIVLILIGTFVGWRWRPLEDREPVAMMRRADRGFGVDAAYLRFVAAPVLALARFAAFVDREIIDFYVRATGLAAGAAAGAGQRVHRTERVSTNLVWVAAGLLLAAGVALWA